MPNESYGGHQLFKKELITSIELLLIWWILSSTFWSSSSEPWILDSLDLFCRLVWMIGAISTFAASMVFGNSASYSSATWMSAFSLASWASSFAFSSFITLTFGSRLAKVSLLDLIWECRSLVFFSDSTISSFREFLMVRLLLALFTGPRWLSM